MELETVWAAVAVAASAVTVAGAVGYATRRALRGLRKLGRLTDRVLGVPADGDTPARPGLLAQVDKLAADVAGLTAEMRPNGGSTLRDAVNRVEKKLGDVEQGLAEHLLAGHVDPTGPLLRKQPPD